MSPPNSRPPLTSRIRASFEGRRHKAELSSPTSPKSQDNESIRTIVEQVINTQPFQAAIATNLAQLIKPNIKDALDTIQPLVEAVYAHEVLLRKTNFSVENLLTKLETDVLRPKSNSTSIAESDSDRIVLPHIRHNSESNSKASENNYGSSNLDKNSLGKTVNANKDVITDSIEGAQYPTLTAETFLQDILPIKQQIKDLELNTEHSKSNMDLMEEKLDEIKSDLSIVISMISEEKGGTRASLDSLKGSRTSLEDHNYAGNRRRDGLSRSPTQGSDSTITMKKKYIKEPKQKVCKDKSHDSNASQELSVVETRSRSPSDSLHTQTLKKLELEIANLKESFDSNMASNDERISTVLATLENHPQTPDNYFVKAIEKLNTNQESQHLALCTLLTERITLARNKEFEELGQKLAQLQDQLKGPDVILEDIRSSNALHNNALVNQTSALHEIKTNMASYDTKLEQHSEAITRLITISSEPSSIVTADNSGLEQQVTSLIDTLNSHTSEFVEIKAANAAHAKVLKNNTANLEQIKADIESYTTTIQNNIELFDETIREALASTQLTYNNSIALGDQIMSIKANVDSQKPCLDKFKLETEFNNNQKFDLVESEIKVITDTLLSHSSLLDQILSKCSTHNVALQTVNDMKEFFKSEFHEIKQSNDANSRTLGSMKSNHENNIDVINQVNVWGLSFNQDMKDIKSLQESYARTSSDNQQKNFEIFNILKSIKDSHELHNDIISGIKEEIDCSASDLKMIQAFHKSHEGAILDMKTSIDFTNTTFGVKLESIESTVSENSTQLELLKGIVQNIKQDITLDFEPEKIHKILEMIVESLAAHSVLLGEIKEDVCAEILTSLHDIERVIQSNSNLLADTQQVDVNAEILTLLHTINEDYSTIPPSLSEIRDHCDNPKPSSVAIALIQKRFADIESAMSEHLNHLISLSSFADSSKKYEDIKLSKLKEVESYSEEILGTSKESASKINDIILKLDGQNIAIDMLNQKSSNQTFLKLLNTLQSTNEISLIKIEENNFTARNISDETKNLCGLIEKIHAFIISAFPQIKSGQEHLENLGEKSRHEVKSELSRISEYLLTIQTILGKASNTIDNTFSEVIKPYHYQDITHPMSALSDSMKKDIQKFDTVVQNFMEKVEENKILLNSITETIKDKISINLTDNGDNNAPNQGIRQIQQNTSLNDEICFSTEIGAIRSQNYSIDSYQVGEKEAIKRNIFSGLNPLTTVNDWQKQPLNFPVEGKVATICSIDSGNQILQTDSQSQGKNSRLELTPECIVKDKDCLLKIDFPSQSDNQNKNYLSVESKEKTTRNIKIAEHIQQNIVIPINNITTLIIQSECKDETEESDKYLVLSAGAATPAIDTGHNIKENDFFIDDNVVRAGVTSECKANTDQYIEGSNLDEESAVPVEPHFQVASKITAQSDLQNEIHGPSIDIKDIVRSHNFIPHVDQVYLHELGQFQDDTVDFMEDSNSLVIRKPPCESNIPIDLDTIRELYLPNEISKPIHDVHHIDHSVDLNQDHDVVPLNEATHLGDNSSEFKRKTGLQVKSVIPFDCDVIVQSNFATETSEKTYTAESIASSANLIQNNDKVPLENATESMHNLADYIGESTVPKEIDASHESLILDEANVNCKLNLATEIVPLPIENNNIAYSDDLIQENNGSYLHEETAQEEPDNSFESTIPRGPDVTVELDLPTRACDSDIDEDEIVCGGDSIQNDDVVRSDEAIEFHDEPTDCIEEAEAKEEPDDSFESTKPRGPDMTVELDLPTRACDSDIDEDEIVCGGDSIQNDDVVRSDEAIEVHGEPTDCIEEAEAKEEPDDSFESTKPRGPDMTVELDLPTRACDSDIDEDEIVCGGDSIQNDDVVRSDEAIEVHGEPTDCIEEAEAKEEPDDSFESTHLDESDEHEVTVGLDLPTEIVAPTIEMNDIICSADSIQNDDVVRSDEAIEVHDEPTDCIEEAEAKKEPDDSFESTHLDESDEHEVTVGLDLPTEIVAPTIEMNDIICSADSIQNDDVVRSDEAIEVHGEPTDCIEEAEAKEEPDDSFESTHLDESDEHEVTVGLDLPTEIVAPTIEMNQIICSADSIQNDDVVRSDEAIEVHDEPTDCIEEAEAKEEPDDSFESTHLDESDEHEVTVELDLPTRACDSDVDEDEIICSADSIQNDDVVRSDEAIEVHDEPTDCIEEAEAKEEPDDSFESTHLDESDEHEVTVGLDLPTEIVAPTIEMNDIICSADSIQNDDVVRSDEAIEVHDEPTDCIEEAEAKEEPDDSFESTHLDESDEHEVTVGLDLPTEIVAPTIEMNDIICSADSIQNDDVVRSDEAIEVHDEPTDCIEEAEAKEEPDDSFESTHLDESDEHEVTVELDLPTRACDSDVDEDEIICSADSIQNDDVVRSDEAIEVHDEPTDCIEEAEAKKEPDDSFESTHLDESDEHEVTVGLDLPTEIVAPTIEMNDIICSADSIQNDDVVRSDEAIEVHDEPTDCIEEAEAKEEPDDSFESTHLDESDEHEVTVELDLPTRDCDSDVDEDEIICSADSIQNDDVVRSDEAIEVHDEPTDCIEEAEAKEEPDDSFESTHLDESDEHEVTVGLDLPTEIVAPTIEMNDIICSADSIQNDDVVRSDEAIEVHDEPTDCIEEAEAKEEPDDSFESTHLDESDEHEVTVALDLPTEIVAPTIEMNQIICSADSIQNDYIVCSDEAMEFHNDPIDCTEDAIGQDDPEATAELTELDEGDKSEAGQELELPSRGCESEMIIEENVLSDVMPQKEVRAFWSGPCEGQQDIVNVLDEIFVPVMSDLRIEPQISCDSDMPMEIHAASNDSNDIAYSEDLTQKYEEFRSDETLDSIHQAIDYIEESTAQGETYAMNGPLHSREHDIIFELELATRDKESVIDVEEIVRNDNLFQDDNIVRHNDALECQGAAAEVVEEINLKVKSDILCEPELSVGHYAKSEIDLSNKISERTHDAEIIANSVSLIHYNEAVQLNETTESIHDLADDIGESIVGDESDPSKESLNSNEVNSTLVSDLPTEIIASTIDADDIVCSDDISQHDDVARTDKLRKCEEADVEFTEETILPVHPNIQCESEFLGEHYPGRELVLPAEVDGPAIDVGEIVSGDDLKQHAEVIRSDDSTDSKFLPGGCMEETQVLDETNASDEPLHQDEPDINREFDLLTENIVSTINVDVVFCKDEHIQHAEVGLDVALESRDDSEKLNNDLGFSAGSDDAMLLVTSIVPMISESGNEDISFGNKLLEKDDDGSPKVVNKCESDSIDLSRAEILSKYFVPKNEINRSTKGNDESSGDKEDVFEGVLSCKDEAKECIKETDMPAGSLECICDNVDNIQGNIIEELDDNEGIATAFEPNVIVAHNTKVAEFPVESVELIHDNDKVLLKNFHRTAVDNTETMLAKKSIVHAETSSDEEIEHNLDVIDVDTKTKSLSDVSKTRLSMHEDSIEEIESSIKNSGNFDIMEGLIIDAVATDSVDCFFDGNGNTENSVTESHYILSPKNHALENLVPEEISLGMEILREDSGADIELPPDQTTDHSTKITKSTKIDRKPVSIHAESHIFERKELKKSILKEETSAEVGNYDCAEIADMDDGYLKGEIKLKRVDTDCSDVEFAETTKMPLQEQISMENSVDTNCTRFDKKAGLMPKKEIFTEDTDQKVDASKAMEINEVIVFKRLPSEVDNILGGAKHAEMNTSMENVVTPKQSETSVDEAEFDVIEVLRKEIPGIPLNIRKRQFVPTEKLTTDEQILNKVLEPELEANSPQNKIVEKLDIDEKLISQVQTDKKTLDENLTIDVTRERLNFDGRPGNIIEDKKCLFGNWEGLEVTKSRNHEAEYSSGETILKSENEDDSSCVEYKSLMIPRKRSEKFEELIRKFEEPEDE
ncbi:BgTH12-01450 [Blumeria graminis f. sp. triticale]|uniref:BgTH12-01450 n=1 Tax=Blumeria graminis f. sp. triticale TaxID=1689686 RepID=A0A9W4CZ72_BLUGR|nr:BgTH12-01450 [Blumeria graminis f. sp. triticale]